MCSIFKSYRDTCPCIFSEGTRFFVFRSSGKTYALLQTGHSLKPSARGRGRRTVTTPNACKTCSVHKSFEVVSIRYYYVVDSSEKRARRAENVFHSSRRVRTINACVVVHSHTRALVSPNERDRSLWNIIRRARYVFGFFFFSLISFP